MSVSPSILETLSNFKATFIKTVNFASYHIYTLWLFTYNDLKTMVISSTAFALFYGIPSLKYRTTLSHTSDPMMLVNRIPIILLWSWVNLLAFAVDNQRQASALEEDRLNKPWRPMPAGRLTGAQARKLALTVYPLAFVASLLLGRGTFQCVSLVFFGYLYNNLKGGDVS